TEPIAAPMIMRLRVILASTDSRRELNPLQKRLIASSRRFERTLQGQQAFAPQLNLFSGEPHIVAFRYRLFLKLDAQLVAFYTRFVCCCAACGGPHYCSFRLREGAPVQVVVHSHADNLGAFLACRTFLYFLLRDSSQTRRGHAKECESRDAQASRL